MNRRLAAITATAFLVFLVFSLLTFYAPIPHDLALQTCVDRGWNREDLILAQQRRITGVTGRTELFEFETNDGTRIRLVLARRAVGWNWKLLEYTEDPIETGSEREVSNGEVRSR